MASPLAARFRRQATAIVDECLELLEDGKLDVPANIHACRKRIKRLRAQLRACRSTFTKRAFVVQDRRLRDAARQLAGYREQTAREEALVLVCRHFGLPEPQRWAVAAERKAKSVAEWEALTLPERRAARALLVQARRDVGTWLGDLPGSKAVDVLTKGALRQWRRAGRAYQRASEQPRPELVHEFRKHLKYFLHQLQLASDGEKQLKEPIEQLQALTEMLGQAHDLWDLRQLLSSLGKAVENEPNWEAILEAREAELTLEALTWGARLFSEPSDKLVGHWQRGLKSKSFAREDIQP